jgi:hypothetical protein
MVLAHLRSRPKGVQIGKQLPRSITLCVETVAPRGFDTTVLERSGRWFERHACDLPASRTISANLNAGRKALTPGRQNRPVADVIEGAGIAR